MGDGRRRNQSSEPEQISKMSQEKVQPEVCLYHVKGESIFDAFHRAFPHGHPNFVKKLVEDARLHSAKNHDYAAGGDPLGNFKRVADILSLYPDFPISTPQGVLITYMLKQLDAVMNQMSSKHEFKVEGLEARMQDVSVYATIFRCMIG